MNRNISYYKDLIKKHFFTFFITFSIIFTLALVYAYFAQRIYLASATIEVTKYKESINSSNNTLQIAIKENTPEDESEILKSNFLVSKAIENLEFDLDFYHYNAKKYFAINKNEFPMDIDIFEIKNKKLYNKKIQIKAIDNETYNISIDTSTMISKIKGSSNIIKFDEKYTYGQLVENENFKLLINKKLIKE